MDPSLRRGGRGGGGFTLALRWAWWRVGLSGHQNSKHSLPSMVEHLK